MSTEPTAISIVRGRRCVGYWASRQGHPYPERPQDNGMPLPDPRDLVYWQWPWAEAVAESLEAPFRLREGHDYGRLGEPDRRVIAYRGYSGCRLCDPHEDHYRHNGTREFDDGTYVWPEGLAHYVRVHGVRLDTEFVHHLLASPYCG